MGNKNTFLSILLIGLGFYFLLRQFSIPILSNFYSWPTILMIVGIAFLVNAYAGGVKQNVFPGAALLGLGIHLHGIHHYSFWIDHWGVYLFILGIAFLLKYQQTKRGLWIGLFLVILSIFSIFSSVKPGWFFWLDQFFTYIEKFWPVVLIMIGFYLMFNRK